MEASEDIATFDRYAVANRELDRTHGIWALLATCFEVGKSLIKDPLGRVFGER